MSTLLIAVASFFGYVVAYHTYGRFLASKIFRIRADEPVPSRELQDDVDFVPANRYVLFGHHFTSIAGTGPIVGPAIAVMWGWLPALLWVVFGCIFIGAVHDFTALVMSVRDRGRSLGDIAGEVLSPIAKKVLLVLLGLVLVVVVAVFANVIAVVFDLYPRSAVPVWTSLPLAVVLGLMIRKTRIPLFVLSLPCLLLIYYLIGAEWVPTLRISGVEGSTWLTPITIWTGILMVYCFFASVLPVWLLLQPRDYINSLQLYLAMGMMVLGMCVAGFSGTTDLFASAPAVRVAEASAQGAPSIWPFLFITIACGAVSGFHALVSSGTSSKQLGSMADARYIGYGAMLVEGALAVLVILACTAGLCTTGLTMFTTGLTSSSEPLSTGEGMRSVWLSFYGRNWSDLKLGEQVGIFILGGGNFIASLRIPGILSHGIPQSFAQAVVAVLVVSFAATTIDTSMRLFRYVLQELGGAAKICRPLANKYVATTFGVVTSFIVAMLPGPSGAPGTGGMILWPLFGVANQLIAGLTLMVGTVWAYQQGRRWLTLVLAVPMAAMLVMPVWAMVLEILEWITAGKYHLVIFGVVLILLAVWLSSEGLRAMRRPALKNLTQEPNP